MKKFVLAGTNSLITCLNITDDRHFVGNRYKNAVTMIAVKEECKAQLQIDYHLNPESSFCPDSRLILNKE